MKLPSKNDIDLLIVLKLQSSSGKSTSVTSDDYPRLSPEHNTNEKALFERKQELVKVSNDFYFFCRVCRV